jgi:hypothetical protein
LEEDSDDDMHIHILFLPPRNSSSRDVLLHLVVHNAILDCHCLGALRQNGLLMSFPYVCPEPVLVKSSFIYINGSKRPFFHLGVFEALHASCGESAENEKNKQTRTRNGAGVSVRVRLKHDDGLPRQARDKTTTEELKPNRKEREREREREREAVSFLNPAHLAPHAGVAYRDCRSLPCRASRTSNHPNTDVHHTNVLELGELRWRCDEFALGGNRNKLVHEVEALRKTPLSFELFLCMSRACLGKKDDFQYKMAPVGRFPYRDTDVVEPTVCIR